MSYDGIRPIKNVLADIRIMVNDNIFLRPYLSPKQPKTAPPNGRNKNGIENVASDAISCTDDGAETELDLFIPNDNTLSVG